MARPLLYRIEDMLDAIEEARSYIGDMTLAQFEADRKTQRAVERCIQVISEAAKDVPKELKAKHKEIPWRNVVGMGDKLRHDYHNIVVQIVWDTVTVHLPPLGIVVRAIKAELPEDG
jgi:uncharacterized protein with HEPN domain